mgnify:CR=1 FL=1
MTHTGTHAAPEGIRRAVGKLDQILRVLNEVGNAVSAPAPLLKTVKLIVGKGPLFSQCQHGDKPNSMGLAQRAANVFYNKSAVIGKIADYEQVVKKPSVNLIEELSL